MGEIIFSDLLKSTLNNDKLKENVAKLEHLLKQEKNVNKDWQVQIKEFKKKNVDLGDDPNKPKLVKNMLKENIHRYKYWRKNSKF